MERRRLRVTARFVANKDGDPYTNLHRREGYGIFTAINEAGDKVLSTLEGRPGFLLWTVKL
jgi:hypothetical protein